MTGAEALPLRFQVGARTLASVSRRLIRIACDLDDVRAGRVPPLPPLAAADGYLLTSIPEGASPAADGLLRHIRQRYCRHHVDLAAGEAAWHAQLSGNTRSSLARKAKKLRSAMAAAGEPCEISRYRTPDELLAFHPLARQVSAITYQERLLGAGLPVGAEWNAILRRAASGDVRAWLLRVGGRPIAYLCCTRQGSALRYDHVGHDPAYEALSPGTVLQVEALRDLFAEQAFAWFDFTEGEGQHKRQLSTGGTPCADIVLLRPTLFNRLILVALARFDRMTAWGKRAGTHPRLARMVRALRR